MNSVNQWLRAVRGSMSNTTPEQALEPGARRIAAVLALGLTIGACSGLDGNVNGREDEPIQDSKTAQVSAETACNRPAPKLPFSFSRREHFSIDGSDVVLPTQLAPEIATSELTASAMVMVNAGQPRKVAFSPAWTVESGTSSLGLPIERVAPNAPSGTRITLAVELKHASGASGWSPAVHLERRDAGWQVLPAPATGPGMSIDELKALLRKSPVGKLTDPTVSQSGPQGSAYAFQPSAQASPSAAPGEPAQAKIMRKVPRLPQGGGVTTMSHTTTNLCFRQSVLMTGEGIGEDFLYVDSEYGSVGMLLYIPGVFFSTLDNSGCTGPVTLSTGTYSVTVWAGSVVNGSLVGVDTNGNDEVPITVFDAFLIDGGAQTVYWWPSAQENFNIALFAAAGLSANPGTTTANYIFHAGNTIACSGGSCNTGGEIYIAPGAGYDKFLVGHEHGHAFFGINTSVAWWADYTASTAAPCNAGDPGGHDIDSKEFSSSTFNEAAASFYGATTFNSTTQTNCWFYHPRYQNGIDCENGQSPPAYDLPLQFMEQKCSTAWSGRGVEIDWLRQLWDVRTDGGSMSMNTILGWINSAPSAFTKDNGYQNLDSAANTVGGSLNTNWDNAKGANGIDW
jgi:hypothetical protein